MQSENTGHVFRNVVELIGIPESNLLLSDELDGGKLNMDSMDRIELAVFLEDDMDIDIPDEDVEGWETLADVVACVDRATGSK